MSDNLYRTERDSLGEIKVPVDALMEHRHSAESRIFPSAICVFRGVLSAPLA